MYNIHHLRAGVAWVVLLVGCGAPPPPPPVTPTAPLPPLERACQEVLPLGERTVGEWVRLVRSIAPRATFATRPCDAKTAWPIAFAESEPGKPPIGIGVLRMEGDALLTFDARDREAPTVKLCAEIDARLDENHRFWATALYESGDDGAFDPQKLESSRAELAWLELRSRSPSPCMLGRREEAAAPEPELAARLRCARREWVTPIADGCPPAAAARVDGPDAAALAAALARTHRFTFAGRDAVRDGELRLAAPERCVYEPPPAVRDACFAVYTRGGERWYGRGDVTRTGTGGVKNYVDSYLTFQLLKRLERERKAQQK